MREDRRTYSPEFKGKVALAAIRNDKSLAELVAEFNVHPEQIDLWKQQLTNNVGLVFCQNEEQAERTLKECGTVNHAKIGDIIAENDFLTKVLGR